jgi:hypothetical protein
MAMILGLAMRLFSRHRNPRDHEPDPMFAIWIHNEYLPIKVEKHIEGRIARWHRRQVIRIR